MRDLIINGKVFTFLGLVDHTRLDGKPTKLYRWRKACEHEGCTNTWEFKTAAINRDGVMLPPDDPSRHYAKRFTYGMCPAHVPKAKRQTYPTTYQSRTRVPADEVAVMRAFAASFEGSRADLYQSLSITFGITPGTAREIVAGRRR